MKTSISVAMLGFNNQTTIGNLHDAYLIESAEAADIVVHNDTDGLRLFWKQAAVSKKPLEFYIDVEQFSRRQQSFPAAKQGAFNQALGKQTKHVIDATAGWAGDALLMCSQGYQVTMIEREPIIALMLRDAMRRLSRTVWAETNPVFIPQVVEGNAIQLLDKSALPADCVYLDPMFPPKRKKNAAANKNMQLLQWLVGQDLDADRLLETAVSKHYPRVAVKRPDYAEPLLAHDLAPSTQFSSKLINYDVYFG